MKYSTNSNQRGAVSLFVVIFSALLITIVTVGFIQVMLRNQQAATTADLSRSAYDSALGGVEDAKRAIVLAAANGTLAKSTECNSVATILGRDPNTKTETVIKQDEKDATLSQAYTCATIDPTPGEVVYDSVAPGKSKIIPLKTVDNKPFNKVVISWKPTSGIPVDRTRPLSSGVTLPRTSEWGVNTPALLRAQLIQTNGSFKLSDFDTKSDGTASDNARTKFLYPFSFTSSPSNSFEFSNDSIPTAIACSKIDDYACKVTLLNLPGDASTRQAFLHISTIYNTAGVKIVLMQDDTVVNFSGVQAKVDSTGRAGDLFRRVKATVDLSNSDFPYPEAALDLTGNLCKTFRVTDNIADYDAGSCTP